MIIFTHIITQNTVTRSMLPSFADKEPTAVCNSTVTSEPHVMLLCQRAKQSNVPLLWNLQQTPLWSLHHSQQQCVHNR